MTSKQREVSGSRRGFFRAVAGLGVAAGTGALALRHGATARAGSDDPARTAASGYRETDHIRKYYDTARG